MKTFRIVLTLFVVLCSTSVLAAKHSRQGGEQQSQPQTQEQNPTQEQHQVVVFDPHLAVNAQLLPYIPNDLSWTNKYVRYPNGTFCAENGAMTPITATTSAGGCAEYVSMKAKTAWKIRYVGQGTAERVFKQENGQWVLWVQFKSGQPSYASAEAQR